MTRHAATDRDPASPAEATLLRGAPVFTGVAESPARHGRAIAGWRALVAHDARHGAGTVRGAFAVGLREASNRVFLAVDRFGIHSLCYRVVNGELRFAERADELAGDDAQLDPQAIYDYLYAHTIPSPRTIFQGVQRLPPGHYALYEDGRLTVAPYWVPEFVDPGPADFNLLRDEFRALLRTAVARQLDGGKPACFLSGGTDSSTVAGLIGQVAGQPASTYSIGFDANGYDEMAYARIAARHFATDHHEYYVTPEDLVRHIPEVAGSYDQPFGNSSVLPAYCCARLARDDGVHRLLAGDGGDELFGGNARYAKQRIFDWYQHVPAALRRGMMEPVLATRAAARVPLVRKGSSYIEQARVPMPDRFQMYNLLLRLGPEQVLTSRFLERIEQDAPLRQQREVWAAARASHTIDRTLAFDWRYTLAENDLPKVTGATALAGLEVGFPFLDHDLFEFSLRLPAHYKLKGLKLRWFFKEALRGFLPDEILTKRKHGFGLPFGVWATSHPRLRALATESLGSMSSRGIVRPQFIDTLVTRLLPEHPGYYGEMVWILMVLEQWLQRHAPSYRA